MDRKQEIKYYVFELSDKIHLSRLQYITVLTNPYKVYSDFIFEVNV